MLLDIFSEYGLKHQQIVSTITDNGSNFIKAFAEFGVTQGIYIVFLIFIKKYSVNSKNSKYKFGLGKFINYKKISFNFIYNLSKVLKLFLIR